MPNPPLVRVVNLEKTLSTKVERFELVVPEFYIDPGEVVVLLGPNGSGKSTFADILGLLTSRKEDRLFEFNPLARDGVETAASLNSKNLEEFRRKHVGYVPQHGGLLGYLSSRMNIALPAFLNDVPDPCAAAADMAQKLGVDEHLAKKTRSLSGGERQRVAIARALIHNPSMVLADEPTAAVDEITAKEIMAEFKELTRSKGTGVLIVTHDLNAARGVADRFYHMRLERIGGNERNRRGTCHPDES
jgi:putative ABC transport system ATP-binding protein